MTTRRPDTGARGIYLLALLDLDAPPRETLRRLLVQHAGNGTRVALEIGLSGPQPLMATVVALGLSEWLEALRAGDGGESQKSTETS